jgi:hypothetical protein
MHVSEPTPKEKRKKRKRKLEVKPRNSYDVASDVSNKVLYCTVSKCKCIHLCFCFVNQIRRTGPGDWEVEPELERWSAGP